MAEQSQSSYPRVKISNFVGGLTPAWFKNEYASYGNSNMANDMESVSLIDPHSLSQGLAYNSIDDTLSNNITSVIGRLVSSDTTYGVGGDSVYEITSTSVSNIHTISGTNPEVEDVVDYNGNLYYSYNDDGDGYIGKYDYGTTWNDTWQGPFSDSPHPLLVGGDNKLYLGTSSFVGDFEEGGTFDAAALDIMSDDVVVDLEWNANRIYVAANSPNIDSGTNIGSIFVWEGASVSWENEITVKGQIKNIFSSNGIVYVFYKNSSGTSCLGYLDGGVVKKILVFDGTLPEKGQVTEYEGYIVWLSDDTVYAYGAIDPKISNALSKLAVNKYSTPGFIANPFGDPITCSTNGTNIDFGDLSGLATTGYWESLYFSVAGDDRIGHVQHMKVNHSDLGDNDNSFKVSLIDASGTEKWSETVDYGMSTVLQPQVNMSESLKIKIDFTGSNNSVPIKIHSITIKGKTDK